MINYYIDFSSRFSDPRSALCLVWEPIYEESNKTQLLDLFSLDVFLETQSNIATVGGGWREEGLKAAVVLQPAPGFCSSTQFPPSVNIIRGTPCHGQGQG